ncbi:hypothetical protein Q7P37_004594 [Cladosporium fusiforme]
MCIAAFKVKFFTFTCISWILSPRASVPSPPTNTNTYAPQTKTKYSTNIATMPSEYHSDRHAKRSRSPRDDRRDRDVRRHRSRSPRRHHHHSHHHSHRRIEDSKPVVLPFRQAPLHRRHLERYYNLFADYLDLQKGHDIADFTEDEVKGRWKSFMGKWNRGELAEGWYDPKTKERADARAIEMGAEPQTSGKPEPREPLPAPTRRDDAPADLDEDDDDFGPTLPPGQKSGPSVPGFQDLQHRQDLTEEEREARIADLRWDRKLDRKTQKERLEELVPRADPGSRERQLEKKREATATNRSFADAKDSGAAEVPDNEMMGGGDGVDEFKAKLKTRERAKNEREIRKEEQLRAREAEREEKLAEHRKKEDKTMEMLKSLAQQRYGGVGS